MGYVYVLLAVLLLAASLVISKVFQVDSGSSLRSGAVYNVLCGSITAILFFALNGFKLSATPYSVGMAAITTLSAGVYTVLSLKIMASGGLALYTFFLMLGGMVLPFVYGLAALDEAFSVWRLLGLLLIVVSMFLTGSMGGSRNWKVLLMCLLVFVANGMVSITSKLHTIEEVAAKVNDTEYIIWGGIIKGGAFALLLPFTKKEPGGKAMFRLKPVAVVALGSLVGGISYLLQLKGAATLPATVLYPMVTGGSILITTLTGFLVFKEKLSRKNVLGIACCFVATFLFL